MMVLGQAVELGVPELRPAPGCQPSLQPGGQQQERGLGKQLVRTFIPTHLSPSFKKHSGVRLILFLGKTSTSKAILLQPLTERTNTATVKAHKENGM